MHGRNFMLIAPLLPRLVRSLSLPSFSLSFLFPSSSAGTWAATWGPCDKCWCVRWVWPRWPVAGSHHRAYQRGICHRCQSGPRRHLLRLCAQDQHKGGCVNTHLQAHTRAPHKSHLQCLQEQVIRFEQRLSNCKVRLLMGARRKMKRYKCSKNHKRLVIVVWPADLSYPLGQQLEQH